MIHMGSHRNTVDGGTFYRNGDAGVIINDSDRNKVIGSPRTSSPTAAWCSTVRTTPRSRDSDLRFNPSGVEAGETNHLLIQNNDASDSLQTGFEIGNGVSIRILDNIAHRTGGAGIGMEGAAFDALGAPVGGALIEGNSDRPERRERDRRRRRRPHRPGQRRAQQRRLRHRRRRRDPGSVPGHERRRRRQPGDRQRRARAVPRPDRHDVVVFAVLYLITGLGITVGFHRLFTHRAFQTNAVVMCVTLAALGLDGRRRGRSIEWVADHRKHHAFSDRHDDPHWPHTTAGLQGALRGLWHAHWGWLFDPHRSRPQQRYARDLIDDPASAAWTGTFLLLVTLGLLLPFLLGGLIGGTLLVALTGLLWGGLVRMLLVHHVTYSINSLCHFFGRRAFDDRRRVAQPAVVAPFTLGEAWHNNHHAFPTSAAPRAALVAAGYVGAA